LCLKQSNNKKRHLNKNGLEKKKSFSKKFLTKASDVDKIINVAEKKSGKKYRRED
jgi:hypothetical protein